VAGTLTGGRQDKSIKVRISEKKLTPADIRAFNSAHVRKISWTPVPLHYMFSLFLFHFVVLFLCFVRDIHCRKRHAKKKEEGIKLAESFILTFSRRFLASRNRVKN